MGSIKSLRWKIIKKVKKTYYTILRSVWCDLIVNPEEEFDTVQVISPASWVTSYFPAVYNMQKAHSGDYYMNELVVYSIQNAIISDNSDLILTNKGCYWEKSRRNDFSVEIPLDTSLLKYEDKRVLVKRLRKEKTIKGKVISLMGVHAGTWAHFVVMQLPKLYYAGENGLLEDSITLLTPKYRDSQLREMVEEYVSRYPSVKWVEVDPNYYYRCESLVFLPTLCVLADHSSYLLPSMEIFPPLLGDLLKKNLIDVFKEKADSIFGEESCHSKIYIIRRNGYRSLVNYQEMEEEFTKKGFVLIDPGKMSFLEKVKVFSYADEIVGPLSGGFVNVMFCKPGAKVMPLSTIPRTLEPFLPFLQTIAGFKMLLVTGIDLDKSTQPNNYIPVERVNMAYNELLNQ